MLGMQDWLVAGAYWANIIVVVICIVYGIINWNRDHEEPEAVVSENDQEAGSRR